LLAPLIALVAAGAMVSGCLGDGNQIRAEFPVLTNQIILQHKHPKSPALVEPWRSDPRLGWEGSISEAAQDSARHLRSWLASIKDKGNNTLLIQRHIRGARGEGIISWKNLVAEAHQ